MGIRLTAAGGIELNSTEFYEVLDVVLEDKQIRGAFAR
jgi:hypothetical protein